MAQTKIGFNLKQILLHSSSNSLENRKMDVAEDMDRKPGWMEKQRGIWSPLKCHAIGERWRLIGG